VAPCRYCVNRRFGGICRLHLQGRTIRERWTSVNRWQVQPKSESKLCYYRQSVGQSILASSPIWCTRPDFCYCQIFSGLMMLGALSDERTCLSFTSAAGPRQRSHFRVRVPRDSWPHFNLSDSRLPQHGESQSQSQSQSHIVTDGQSVCLSWCRASAGAHDQLFLLVWKLLSCPCGAPSLTRGRVCHLSVIVLVSIYKYLQVYTSYVILCTICTRSLSVQAQYSKLCTISSSFRYNGSLVIWTVVCLTAAKFKLLILSPVWRARSTYLYPPGTGWPNYTPRHWIPFSSPSTTRRATMEAFEPVSTLCSVLSVFRRFLSNYPMWRFSWFALIRLYDTQRYCSK
jgi:hypothetical protein